MTSPAAIAQATFQLPSSAFDTPALVNPGSPDIGGILTSDDQPDPPVGVLPSKGTHRLMKSLAELDQAREGYLLAEQMYDGEFGDLQVSEVIQRLLASSGANEIEDLCYAKVPVDTIAEKLAIRAVTTAPKQDPGAIPPPEEETTDEEREQDKALTDAADAAIREIRAHNQLGSEEPEMMLKVSKYGDAYLEVWPSITVVPDPQDDDTFDGTQQLEPGEDILPDAVDMFVCSPMNVRMFYDEEQPLRVSHAIKAWEWCNPDDPADTPPQLRANIYTATATERWICKAKGDPNRPDDWQPLPGEDGMWPLPHPAGVDRVPFFHLRTARPYGTPEHRAAYGPQKLINKLVNLHGVTIDFHGFPQRYALLDPKGDQSILNLLDADHPEDDGDDPEGDGHSPLRADPAAVWKLVAQAVGTFAPADPSVFMVPLDRYIKAISELCGIPLDRFVGYTTPPSGESRRVGNEVLYEKAGDRRTRHGGEYAAALEFALGLLGVTGVKVIIKWRPLDMAVSGDDWDTIGKKIANGVPVKQALIEAGYPDEEVGQWLLDLGGADLTRRVLLLNSLGTAIQAIAAGVGVGLVSREQAGDIFARVMGEVGAQLPALEQPVMIQPPPIPPQMPPPGAGGGKPGDEKPGGPAGADPAVPQMPPLPEPVAVGVDQ